MTVWSASNAQLWKSPALTALIEGQPVGAQPLVLSLVCSQVSVPASSKDTHSP
jgi:hypothetical protein